MNREDTGTLVLGASIALVGLALLLDRAGILPWTAQWSVWPLLLIAYGVSRMAGSRSDAPRGLFWVAAGAWLLAGEAGWISFRDTWPLLLVALGAAIAWGSFVGPEPAPLDAGGGQTTDAGGATDFRRRVRRRHGSPLFPIAIIALIVVASRTNAERHSVRTDPAGVVHAAAVLGVSKHVSTADVFSGAEVVAVMGRSELDLRRATLASGTEVTVDVTTVMGDSVIRVPDDWVVDVRTIPVAGGVRDRRFSAPDAAAQPAPGGASSPHLVLRGYVIMGGLTITS